MLQEAQRRVGEFLSPCTVEQFLDHTLVGGFEQLGHNDQASRTRLLGSDPQALLLQALHLAPKLTFHSANPLGAAPSLDAVASAEDFRQRIELFHSRNYSVRFPELRPVSPELDLLARAFEVLLHQPVTTSAFWSRGGMRAPVHYDDHDLLVVQLLGNKRWYVSKRPSELNNTWKGIPGEAPQLGPHFTIDMRPGDLVYLPRGTHHSVDCEFESVHVAIGFTPLTVRDAVIATLDHLSDVDQNLRKTIGGRLAFQLIGPGFERLAPPALDAVARLSEACRTPGFLAAALQRRSARIAAALHPLVSPAQVPQIDRETMLLQAQSAFCHLTANPDKIDFSYPGGHLYIHRGAQESLLYMVNTPRFRVRDIPGSIDDAVRISLSRRLVEVGFLEVAQ
ncbi:MAG TPA: cupin domain-containing protein [Steroidobacteraceae bacterium]